MSLFNFSFPRPSLLSFRTFLPSFLTLPFQKGKVRKEGRKVVTVFLTLPFWKGKVRKEGRKVRKTEGRKVKQRHKYMFEIIVLFRVYYSKHGSQLLAEKLEFPAR